MLVRLNKIFNSGWAIFLIAGMMPLAWNFWNIGLMRQLPDADLRLRHGVTVATSDDVSYLRPAEELLARIKGEAYTESVVVRSPGYGVLYMLPRSLFEPATALGLLTFLQVFLFAASVVLLWHTLQVMGINGKILWACTLIIAMMPTFHGFLFYTLTEAVTPAYVLICLASALLLWRTGERRWLWIGGSAWCILTLTRPILLWAGLPLLWVVLHGPRGLVRGAVLLLLACLPTVIWWLGESHRSGMLLSPHPVYRPESNSLFRPTHRAFWDLAKSWGMRGDHFHSIMEQGFHSALEGSIGFAAAEAFIADAPDGHLSYEQQAMIKAAFHEWQVFTSTIHAPLVEQGALFETRRYEEEERIVARLDEVARSYRRDHPFTYHFQVPLRVLKDMLLHSNLNLYMFQHTYRGTIPVEALRWASLIIHVCLLMLVFLVPWMAFPAPLRIAAVLALLYLGFLAYVQRGVEERYTLPVLHLCVLFGAAIAQRYFPSRDRSGSA